MSEAKEESRGDWIQWIHRMWREVSGSDQCPVPHENGGSGDGRSCAAGGSSSSCAAAAGADIPMDFKNMMPATAEQRPAVGQRHALPMERVTSSIPKGSETPKHQSAEAEYWQYPSQQMFFNAMKRKGWQPQEMDMPAVVGIHNAVNERCWNEILKWEQLHCQSCPHGPVLVRFSGDSKKISPKARILNWMGYTLPFDRHDWVIDRCGRQVRYVIDFYTAAPPPGQAAAMYIDVRPALDSVGAAWDRIYMQGRWMWSGEWTK